MPNDVSCGSPSDICQSLAKGASLQGTDCMRLVIAMNLVYNFHA